MRVALTRAVSPRLSECELSHLPRDPIDIDLAVAQHSAYCVALAQLGCDVRPVPETPELPDGVFVEDAAIVFDELAIMTRSRARSRRPERATVEAVLEAYRPIARITEPGTLDGGDVLTIGRRVLVGLSARTNEASVTQMQAILGPLGYDVTGIPVTGCLHLKSACTAVGPDLVVANRAWLDGEALVDHADAGLIDVDPSEPRGANHLRVGERVLSPASCPKTVARLRSHGINVVTVDVSALEQAESGVTCSSLIFDA